MEVVFFLEFSEVEANAVHRNASTILRADLHKPAWNYTSELRAEPSPRQTNRLPQRKMVLHRRSTPRCIHMEICLVFKVVLMTTV